MRSAVFVVVQVEARLTKNAVALTIKQQAVFPNDDDASPQEVDFEAFATGLTAVVGSAAPHAIGVRQLDTPPVEWVEEAGANFAGR